MSATTFEFASVICHSIAAMLNVALGSFSGLKPTEMETWARLATASLCLSSFCGVDVKRSKLSERKRGYVFRVEVPLVAFD